MTRARGPTASASSSSSSSSSRDDAREGGAASDSRASRIAREWLAAGVGCALADTMFNPLEILKVRAQQTSRAPSALAAESYAERGFLRGLMVPGLAATWMRGLSYTGFRIGLYPSVRDETLRVVGSDGFVTRLCAGAFTGGVGALVFNPIDVIRVRMQSYECVYGSTLGAFKEVAREEGVRRGLWRGTGACVARAMTLSGSQLATYDLSKRWLLQRGVFTEDAPPLHFTSSFLSGCVAQTVTQPVDTLKTLVMSKPSGDDRGAIAIATEIIKKRGVQGLYRGYWAATARQGPVMVIQMPLVEALRRYVFGLEYF